MLKCTNSSVDCNVPEFFSFPCTRTIDPTHANFNLEYAIVNFNNMHKFHSILSIFTRTRECIHWYTNALSYIHRKKS